MTVKNESEVSEEIRKAWVSAMIRLAHISRPEAEKMSKVKQRYCRKYLKSLSKKLVRPFVYKRDRRRFNMFIRKPSLRVPKDSVGAYSQLIAFNRKFGDCKGYNNPEERISA